MRQLKQRLEQLDRQINNDMQMVKEKYQELRHGIGSWVRSPRTLGGAVLIGFLATYKGHARQEVLSFAKRHFLSLSPLASLPLLGKVWHFLPLVSAVMLRKKHSKK